MPYKHNASRRHQIKKTKYRVTNLSEYNQTLRQRGDITVWFTDEAIANWRPQKTGKRGRPMEYSAHAIEAALLVRQVFRLALRQTEGFMNSIARLLQAVVQIPDYSSLSKRSSALPVILLDQAMQAGSMVIAAFVNVVVA